MFDIATDIFRALLTGAIFFSLRAMRGKESPRLRKAWIFFIVGFGFLFFGGLLSIADNFPTLNRYLSFGRHHYADFLEQVVGYFLGLLLVGIGFWRWIPAILALRAEEIALRKSQAELSSGLLRSRRSGTRFGRGSNASSAMPRGMAGRSADGGIPEETQIHPQR